jgi:colicin import membrane protein
VSALLASQRDRSEFAPPVTPGFLRALLLALIAHGLLMAALTWGISWNHEAKIIAVEAELWSALPQEAAPPELLAPPEPPKPVAPPPPAPELVPKVSQVDIALEREKKAKAKLEQERQEKIEKLALEKKRQQDKLELDKKKEQEAKAREKQKAADEAKLAEKRRQEVIQRNIALAGGTGAANATGTSLQASAPSATYAGRIVGRVKPNIVYTEDTSGNPSAVVEVRTAPDGTIVGRKLLKASGVPAWDEAVLKAIDKTEVLPRDTDGRVPPNLVITFRPRD